MRMRQLLQSRSKRGWQRLQSWRKRGWLRNRDWLLLRKKRRLTKQPGLLGKRRLWRPRDLPQLHGRQLKSRRQLRWPSWRLLRPQRQSRPELPRRKLMRRQRPR